MRGTPLLTWGILGAFGMRFFCSVMVLLGISTLFVAAEDKALEGFTEDLITYLNGGEATRALLNKDVFYNRVLEGIDLKPAEKEDLLTEFKSGDENLLAELRGPVQSADGLFTLLRKEEANGEQVVLLRLLSNLGVNYLKVYCGKNDSGQYQIHDLYSFFAGELTSKTIRRTTLTMVAYENQGFISRLMSEEAEFVRNFDQFMAISEAFSRQDHQKVLEIYNKSADAIRDAKAVQFFVISSSSQASEEVYMAALKRYEELFPNDVSLDLMNIDSSFLRKDYDGALERINRLDAAVKDPYLDVMRGSVYMMKEDLQSAERFAKSAMEREPNLFQAVDLLLLIYINTENYAQALTLLPWFQKQGFEVETIMAIDFMKDFAASEEYKTWAAENLQ